jgi:hypothetical protein
MAPALSTNKINPVSQRTALIIPNSPLPGHILQLYTVHVNVYIYGKSNTSNWKMIFFKAAANNNIHWAWIHLFTYKTYYFLYLKFSWWTFIKEFWIWFFFFEGLFVWETKWVFSGMDRWSMHTVERCSVCVSLKENMYYTVTGIYTCICMYVEGNEANINSQKKKSRGGGLSAQQFSHDN